MVHEILMQGRESPIKGKDLCERLDLTPRNLTAAIERERRQGYPICASVRKPFGYFLASNKDEMQEYCGRLRHRAGEIFKTRRACMALVEGLPDAETEKTT